MRILLTSALLSLLSMSAPARSQELRLPPNRAQIVKVFAVTTFVRTSCSQYGVDAARLVQTFRETGFVPEEMRQEELDSASMDLNTYMSDPAHYCEVAWHSFGERGWVRPGLLVKY